MKIKKFSLLLAVGALVALLGWGTSGARALGPILYDGFDNLTAVNPDGGGQWWVLNTGLLDGAYHVYNDFAGDGTAVVPKNEVGVSYVSLEEYTTQAAGNYYNAELAELHTGYNYGQPTQWNPEPNHPVTMEARVRWSGNYLANGGGGAVGSSGIWLWNSPIDYETFTAHPQDGIGFQWVDAGSSFSPGLHVGMVDDSFPVFQLPLMNINMQEWNTFKLVWGIARSGNQYVDIYVNDMYRGQHILMTPMANLSVEVWNDNQKPVDRAGTIVFATPTSTQSLDVDYIKVEKL